MIRQSIITILALCCSWSAMAECPENQVCSNPTPAISGHEYPTDMPEWNVAPSENNTIGTGPISVRPIQDLDPDGDEVIADSKTYQWCNDQECFVNSHSSNLTINPSDIDKVFDKGVGFKPLTVKYSGKVDKGYPEATRTFESEPLPVALEYPPDGTIGICYEAGNKAVLVMALNIYASGDHTHYLQFPNMALGSLPGQLSQVANGSGVNFTSVVNAFIPTFQEKALPEQLTVQYCHDDCTEWAEFEVIKQHPGPGAPTIYNAGNIGLVSDGITVDQFNFQIAAQSNTDYRTNMVHCTQF